MVYISGVDNACIVEVKASRSDRFYHQTLTVAQLVKKIPALSAFLILFSCAHHIAILSNFPLKTYALFLLECDYPVKAQALI